MDLTPPSPTPSARRFPRTRGDGPARDKCASHPPPVSPHTRGWTLGKAGRAARTRGDGPCGHIVVLSVLEVSPHTRGWTRTDPDPVVALRGFPAHAGMDLGLLVFEPVAGRFPRTRGDGPCCHGHRTIGRPVSPHTRGWTRDRDRMDRRDLGFPAHAGMDPCRSTCRASRRRFPRTRGDGPRHAWTAARDLPVSPHTRGWTHSRCGPVRRRPGFPAHAGMDPRSSA